MMAKKAAKKQKDEDIEEAAAPVEEEEEEETPKKAPSKFAKGKAKDEEEETDEDEEELEVAPEAKEIFEERSQAAKQFEEKPKEDITEERTYNVNLVRARWLHPTRRAKRAIHIVRNFFTRHMKPTQIVIDPELNQFIWSRGIQNPPRHVTIRATKTLEGLVTLYLA